MANRKKRCKHCKTFVDVIMGKQTQVGFYCCTSCLQAHGIALRDKQRAKALAKQKRDYETAVKAEKKDLTHRKKMIRPITKFKKDTEQAFNRFIRLRDYLLGCPSCNRTKAEVEANDMKSLGGFWDAGHFLSRGARPELRFEELNVHKQCKKCNGGAGRFSHKAHTVDQVYRISLIKKIGLKQVEFLECEQPQKKWTKEELLALKDKYNKKANLLQKQINEQNIFT